MLFDSAYQFIRTTNVVLPIGTLKNIYCRHTNNEFVELCGSFMVSLSNQAAELVGHIEALGTAHVAHQLGQAVLIQVNHNYRCRLKAQYRLDEAGTYGASPTNPSTSSG